MTNILRLHLVDIYIYMYYYMQSLVLNCVNLKNMLSMKMLCHRNKIDISFFKQ